MDSATKAGAVGGAVRDLIGWLDPNGGHPAWRAAVSSPAGYFCALRGDR